MFMALESFLAEGTLSVALPLHASAKALGLRALPATLGTLAAALKTATAPLPA